MNEAMTETIPAIQTSAQHTNEAMTETIPAIQTSAQHTNEALTEAIPAIEISRETDAALEESAEMIWTGPHPAIAESAEIIWCPAIGATTDSGPAAEAAQAAVTAQIPATMVEATDTAQFILTEQIADSAPAAANASAVESTQTAGSEQAGAVPGTNRLQAARHARGRHAAPRSAGSRPSAGLARRGEGRHAANRAGAGAARRFALSVG